MDQIIDAIRDELAKNATDPALQAIGEYLTRVIMEYPEEAKKIKGKEPAKDAFNAIRKYAEGHKTGTYAFVGPVQAAQVIDERFGLEHGGVWAFEPAVKPDMTRAEEMQETAERSRKVLGSLHLVEDDEPDQHGTASESSTGQKSKALDIFPVSESNPQTSADSVETGGGHPAALDMGLDLDALLAGL